MQPSDTLKIGDIYLKSIDKHHRRQYEKYLGNENSERDEDRQTIIQQLYVSDKLIVHSSSKRCVFI